MKNILMITFAFSLALLTGCGGFYGRGGMGAYGAMGPGYGSMPYGMPGGAMGSMPGGAMAGPMVGTPMMGGGLPVGARGRMSPYGGSGYFGTAYANPEAVVAADRTRRAWRDGSSAGVVASPCSDGSCPTPMVEAPADPELEARIEAVEDQLLADHGVPR